MRIEHVTCYAMLKRPSREPQGPQTGEKIMPNHCSLALILGFDVTVEILSRKIVFCFAFIYVLSLLFESCRLSEFTLAGPRYTERKYLLMFDWAEHPTLFYFYYYFATQNKLH